MIRFVILLTLFCFSSALYAFDMETFRKAISKHEKVYGEYTSTEAARLLFDEGRVSEANRQLKSLVPDSEKSAYDYFILGNMLFELDPDSSYRYMKEAEKRGQDNPFILFERGIHEHRRRNYSAAEEYYEQFQKSGVGEGNPILNAYLTHVYLMNRKVDDAFRSWKKAKFGDNHTSIEKAMYTIFSDADQENEREGLIGEIKAGDTYKLCDLYALDSQWEIDWWNHKPKENYLKYDRNLAKQVLKPGSRDESFFEFCSSQETIEDDSYLQRLSDLDVLSGKNELPESPSLVYSILKNLMSRKLLTAEEFLKKFEPQLIEYSKRYPHTGKYYDVLAYLYANTGNSEKLSAVDLHGWKELKLEKYAASYLYGLGSDSSQFASALQQALADFPDSPMLNKLRLSHETSDRRDALISFVASQFSDVRNNWKGPYRLNDFMASLRHELDQLEDSVSVTN